MCQWSQSYHLHFKFQICISVLNVKCLSQYLNINVLNWYDRLIGRWASQSNLLPCQLSMLMIIACCLSNAFAEGGTLVKYAVRKEYWIFFQVHSQFIMEHWCNNIMGHWWSAITPQTIRMCTLEYTPELWPMYTDPLMGIWKGSLEDRTENHYGVPLRISFHNTTIPRQPSNAMKSTSELKWWQKSYRLSRECCNTVSCIEEFCGECLEPNLFLFNHRSSS